MLLDSVILIDHLNGIDLATSFISQHYKKLAISSITRTEVLSGMRDNKKFINTQLFLDHFQQISVNTSIADLAAKLRIDYRFKTPDALQAACAISQSRTLATRNTKDFKPELHDFVMIPYQIN